VAFIASQVGWTGSWSSRITTMMAAHPAERWKVRSARTVAAKLRESGGCAICSPKFGGTGLEGQRHRYYSYSLAGAQARESAVERVGSRGCRGVWRDRWRGTV
jgi:hypothetical protein